MIYTVDTQAEFLWTPSTSVDQADDITGLVTELLSDVDRIGVGLAAVQIGVHKAVFVAQLDGPDKPFTVVINPRYAAANPRRHFSVEGCLSVPDQHYSVMRYQKIIASFFDRSFRPRTRTLQGFPARVFQHETGHIRGELISDIGHRIETQHQAL